MVDVRAAGLDREGNAERSRQPHRCRAIRIEKFRVDQVEGCLFVEGGDQREQRIGNPSRVADPTDPRDQPESWAIYIEAMPCFMCCQGPQRAILPQPVHRPGRHPDRIDDRHPDVLAACQFCGLPFDKYPETGGGGIGEQCRKGQDMERTVHGRLRSTEALKLPYQTDRNTDPFGVTDNLLARTAAQRQDLQPIVLAPDQPTEQESPGRARDEHIPV